MKDVTGAAALAIQHEVVREKLASALRNREDFISIASHELRTPLTPLKMQAQLILQILTETGLGSHPRQKDLIGLAEGLNRQVNKFLNLSEDLLKMTRIDSGNFMLSRQDCDLSKIVKEVALHYSEEIKRAQCPLEIEAEKPVVGHWEEQ